MFDGYGEGPSTKDATHLRCNFGNRNDVKFSKEMKWKFNKDGFLSNSNNKQRFIYLLAMNLEDVIM